MLAYLMLQLLLKGETLYNIDFKPTMLAYLMLQLILKGATLYNLDFKQQC